MAETHLKTHHHPSIIRVDGFQIFRRDRIARRAGGVAVLVNEKFPASEVVIGGDDRSFELFWIRVEVPGRVVLIGALYHPPRPIYHLHHLLARLEHTVDELCGANHDALLILGGDFNQLEDDAVVEATGLIPLIHQPTRGVRSSTDSLSPSNVTELSEY